MDSLSLLQGIFPTLGSNPDLLHCGQILYQLSHKGSPRILEWGSLSLLQQIFRTQESTWDLLCCKRFFITVHPVCPVMSMFVDFLSLLSFVDLAYIGNPAINTFVCLYRRREIIRLSE